MYQAIQKRGGPLACKSKKERTGAAGLAYHWEAGIREPNTSAQGEEPGEWELLAKGQQLPLKRGSREHHERHNKQWPKGNCEGGNTE